MLSITKFFFRKMAYLIASLLIITLILGSCKKTETIEELTDSKQSKGKSLEKAVSTSEGFEVGVSSPKTAYDIAPTGSTGGDDVTLQSKLWNLYDALIGNLSTDKKTGSWSARIRNTGKITMLYDVNSISPELLKKIEDKPVYTFEKDAVGMLVLLLQ